MPQVFLCWKWPVKNLVNSDLSSFFNVRAVYFRSCIVPSTYCHAILYTRKSWSCYELTYFCTKLCYSQLPNPIMSCLMIHIQLVALTLSWILPKKYFRCHHECFCTHFDTGKSLSEALIFVSTNPQYDDRLFIELQVQYMKIPWGEHVVYWNCF